MLGKRKSGLLLHISSLPSKYGIGDLGPEAYRFADFLAQSKQTLWQVLPLNETNLISDNSPYHNSSAYAGNPLLISPDILLQEGLLLPEEVMPLPDFPEGRVDYAAVTDYKKNLFQLAFKRFKESRDRSGYERFCSENEAWLHDFALFKALKANFGGRAWHEWPPELRNRREEALKKMSEQLADSLEKEKFLQYIFYKEWCALRSYCNQKGIRIIGDMAIYMEYDSVEVWKNPEIFKLDKNKLPVYVSGVPPDYFSKTGQLWGHPVYNWEVLRQNGYDWWIKRLEQNFRLFDIVRIDHFRGFVAYWEVRAGEKTAIAGKWVEAPAVDFFKSLLNHFSAFPIIAEDLGMITPDVHEVMNYFGFPGMRVLLFAFGEDNPDHPYLPHNFIPNCMVYTGTHDNNTVRGWFEEEAPEEDKRRLFEYLGRSVSAEEIHWEFIRLAMDSVADNVILPMQDVLGLGVEARINNPSTPTGNWLWRLRPGEITPEVVDKLAEITKIYGRA